MYYSHIMPKPSVVERLHAIPTHGRPFTTKKQVACNVCGRSIYPLGRLVGPGFPTCSQRACELISARDLHDVLRGRYGPALTRANLAAWGRLYDVGGRLLIPRDVIVGRAQDLADRLVDLVRWQEAFDQWEQAHDLDGWRRGAVRHIPPRRIEDVAALRAFGPLPARDPLTTIPSPDREALRAIWSRL